jgi:IclR family transcriptional regulator, KDG regulon repressor
MKKTRKGRKVDYDKNFVGVAQKLFAILESLSQQPKAGVSLDEITSLSGLPKTTVHRLLYSMNKLDYVEQDPVSNLYSLSGKFFELGTNALPYQRLTVIAKPLMQRLLLTFGESVNLAVPQSGSLMYILVLESPKAHRVAATVGEQSHLHSTSVGKCIAAYLSLEERQQHVTRYGLPSMTSSTITSLELFDRELARVRREGVAIDNEENLPGIVCVGGPIFSSAPKPIAALSVSGPKSRMSSNLPAIKEALREATRTISTLLGSTGPRRGDEAIDETAAAPVTSSETQPTQ